MIEKRYNINSANLKKMALFFVKILRKTLTFRLFPYIILMSKIMHFYCKQNIANKNWP